MKQLFLAIFLFQIVLTFKIMDLDNLKVLSSPKYCSKDLQMLLIVHSAPKNVELRHTIRQTWGKNLKRVFVLGQNSKWDPKIEKESKKFKDILQVNFQDSYRNLTYKHLIGYWWASNHCQNSRFILKTDDDQVLDVFHLPHYLKNFVQDQDPFYLCPVLSKTEPQRNSESKWFVDFGQFSDDFYPDYCSGYVQVTNIKTIKIMLELSKSEKYFFIDDLFITGILMRKFPSLIRIYDWTQSFLNGQGQETHQVLYGDSFEPKWIGASDIQSPEIKTLFEKFKICHQTMCYLKMYNNDLKAIQPTLKILNKDEL